MEQAGRLAIAVNFIEKITTEDEQEWEKMDAHLDKHLMLRQRLLPQPPPMKEEEDFHDDWSFEECVRRGWKICPECLKGNSCEGPALPERVVKKEVEAVVVNGCETILPYDVVTKLIEEARENMDDKEYYAYLDSLYQKQPLAPEECDNASSPDELVGSSSRRKKIKRAGLRKKKTPSLWTFKLFKRRITTR